MQLTYFNDSNYQYQVFANDNSGHAAQITLDNNALHTDTAPALGASACTTGHLLTYVTTCSPTPHRWTFNLGDQGDRITMGKVLDANNSPVSTNYHGLNYVYVINAGGGADTIEAHDGIKETIDCGGADGAQDHVFYDKGLDVLQNCNANDVLDYVNYSTK